MRLVDKKQKAKNESELIDKSGKREYTIIEIIVRCVVEHLLYTKLQPFLVDEKSLTERMGGQMSLWEECVRLFPREEIIEDMNLALRKEDFTSLYALTHRLKGNLANFGFGQTSEKAADLMCAIREKDILRINSRYEVLKEEYLQIIGRIGEVK